MTGNSQWCCEQYTWCTRGSAREKQGKAGNFVGPCILEEVTQAKTAELSDEANGQLEEGVWGVF